MGKLSDESFIDRLLVAEKSQFLCRNTLLLGQEAREFKIVTEHEHDEGSDGGVAIVTRRVDSLFASKMLDQALSLKHELGVINEETG